MECYIGLVMSVDDNEDGDRIRAYVQGKDSYTYKNGDSSTLPWAFPLMPKMLHIKPKVHESVLIIETGGTNAKQRFYIGPIISQPHKMHFDHYATANSTLNGGKASKYPSLDTNPKANGVYSNDDSISIYGRANSDLILNDNDASLRCGVRLTDNLNRGNISLNRENPSYMLLKRYNVTPLSDDDGFIDYNTSLSTSTVVADNITLVSTKNKDGLSKQLIDIIQSDSNVTSNDKSNAMKEIIEKAHALPYGDKLLDFLILFMNAFTSHTHKALGSQPVPDDAFNKLQTYDKGQILCKNIKIS